MYSNLVLAALLVIVQPGATQNKGAEGIQANTNSNQNVSKAPRSRIAPVAEKTNTTNQTKQPTPSVAPNNIPHSIVFPTPVAVESPKDKWDKALVLFTGLLVAVGLFQVIYLWKTVQATSANAIAARDMAELSKDVERPWIEVTIETPAVAEVGDILVVFRNHGRTVAKINDIIIAKVQGVTIQDMSSMASSEPEQSQDAETFSGETLLAPGGQADKFVSLLPCAECHQPLEFNRPPCFIWIWGVVRYSESVTPYSGTQDRNHVTNFCYACRFPVVNNAQAAMQLSSNPDNLRRFIVERFRKTGAYPLNKYT